MRRTMGRFGFWKPLVWGCILLVGGFVMVRFAPAQPPESTKFSLRFAQAFGGPLAVQLFQIIDSSAGGSTYVSLGVTTCDDQCCYSGAVELAPGQYAFSQGGASVAGPIDMTLFADCSEPPLSMEVTVGDLTWKTFGQNFPGHSSFQFRSLFGGRSHYSSRTSEREANATGFISGGIELDLADADFASVGRQDDRYTTR